jgi:hypothetical protein
MDRARAGNLAVLGLLVAMAVTLMSQSRATKSHASMWPVCLEGPLAAGDYYPFDRGMAIAVARGIGARDPVVGELINAVTAYEAAHPVTADEALAIDGPSPRGPMTYVLLVVTLAEHPELATPDVMSELLIVARGRAPESMAGGIRGLYAFLHDVHDSPWASYDLAVRVGRRLAYVRATGAAPLEQLPPEVTGPLDCGRMWE